MNDNWAADWADGGGIEVEGAVEVFPGRHVRGKGGMAEEVQGELGLQKKLVPEEVGKRIRDDVKDGKEVSFKSAYGAFGYIAAMAIWREKLEGAFPFVNDGATILGASPILDDLDINNLALGFEARHDGVVGSNAILVVA